MNYLFGKNKDEFCSVGFDLYSRRMTPDLQVDTANVKVEMYYMTCSEGLEFFRTLRLDPTSYSEGRPWHVVAYKITDLLDNYQSGLETPAEAAVKLQLFMNNRNQFKERNFIERK